MRQAAALGLACALACGAAHAHPFTVEDLLELQDLGRTAFSPDGRWLIMDVQAPWSSAPRFDLDAMTYLALGRPMVVDIAGAGSARPLLPFEPEVGYSTGAFSPDGSRVIVYRLKGHDLELGVVTLKTGVAWWSGQTVEPEVFGATARWIARDRFVFLARTAADSRALPHGFIHQERSTQAWAQAASGRSSVVAIGSGRYRSINPPPPPARLVLADMVSGKLQTLAEGAFGDIAPSPDGERVALVEDAEPLPSGLEAPSAFKSSQRRRLVLVDLSSGRQSIPCSKCDLARLPLTWSPDSRAVLAAARQDDGPAVFAYWTFPFGAGATPIAPALLTGESLGRDPTTVGAAAWLAGKPVVLARRANGERLDWWRLTGGGPVKLTGNWPGPPGPPIATGEAGVLLASAAGPAVLTAAGTRRVTAAEGRLGFTATLAGDRPISVVASTNGWTRSIWPSRGAAWPYSPGDAERLLDVAPALGLTAGLSRDGHGVKSVIVRGRNGVPRTVLTLNPWLDGWDPARPIAVQHKGAGGEARTSWLYLPREGEADVPLVVIPYPGAAYPSPPADAEPGEVALVSNIQVLTSAGYGVLVPSLPLAADADPGKDLAAAILAPVDAALQQHANLSRTRLAIWGQSFGGWGALMAATQTNRFKAVIATSPITDLFTYFGHLGPQSIAAPDRYLALPSLFGWSETGQGRMLGPPWQDRERNFRNSPALLTNKITAPVMLVTSDSDFTSGQSTPVFAALYRQDKDVQLVTYRGEGHVPISPGNVRDLYARALAFLADSLGGPAPDGSKPSPVARPSQ